VILGFRSIRNTGGRSTRHLRRRHLS
jgi:hypothetical protein